MPGRPRERRYYREDVERLKERKEARRDPARAAARGLHWGGPVLESGITLIHDGRFYYRGRDALALAETASLEDVAALLWAADETRTQPRCSSSRRALPPASWRSFGPARGSAHACFRRAADRRSGRSRVLRPASRGGPADRRPHHPAVDDDRRAARLAAPAHRALQARVGAEARRGRRRDSHRAGPLRGPRAERVGVHRQMRGVGRRLALRRGLGGDGDAQGLQARRRRERVLALLAEAEHAEAALAIAGGQSPAPRRDACRVSAILFIRPAIRAPCCCCGWRRRAETSRRGGRFETSGRRDRSCCTIVRIWISDWPRRSHAPTGLPEQAPVLLFALGRTIGWIAHAIEEYASGQLIRPRARYTGPMP